MKHVLKLLCLVSFFGIGVFAQTGNDEYKKNEFYVGYSLTRIDDVAHSVGNGFEVAYVRNFSRFFGVKGDISTSFNKSTRTIQTSFTPPSTVDFDRTVSLYNFLGGIQIKDNASKARFKPFAHVLAGAAIDRSSNKNFRCTSGTCPTPILQPSTFTNTHFSAAFGGGLDVKVNDKVDLRLIQVDYNPIFTGGGHRRDNIRFGIGFVFK